jgi:hypothetical protein
MHWQAPWLILSSIVRSNDRNVLASLSRGTYCVIVIKIVDHTPPHAVPDWLEAIRIELIDSLFADARHEAVFRRDLVIRIVGFRDPVVVLEMQALNSSTLLLDR